MKSVNHSNKLALKKLSNIILELYNTFIKLTEFLLYFLKSEVGLQCRNLFVDIQDVYTMFLYSAVHEVKITLR